MDALGRVFRSRRAYERAQRLARAGNGPLGKLPGPLAGWTAMRELPEVPAQPFRAWWAARDAGEGEGAVPGGGTTGASPAGSTGRVDPGDTTGRSHG
jgi:L-lactate dehydrogenase complex protein LldF